jgi:hypothetical protein
VTGGSETVGVFSYCHVWRNSVYSASQNSECEISFGGHLCVVQHCVEGQRQDWLLSSTVRLPFWLIQQGVGIRLSL